MKIIIDTNVFMSGIFWSGPPAKILENWQNKKLELILSTEILDEYIRVGKILSRKYSGIDIDEIIDILIKSSKIYNVSPLKTQVCRDPDDDKFIACAIATNVKIIVSGDQDLLELDGYQNIRVMKPRHFIET